MLGLGQLMIDYAATVDDNILNQLQVPKGGRRWVVRRVPVEGGAWGQALATGYPIAQHQLGT